jgi:hypothetical protein
MFAGSSTSYDEGEKKRLSGPTFLPQRDDEYRPSKVLGIRIDDASFPLFRPRVLYWLEGELLLDVRLVPRLIWRRRRSLQGKFIPGKMSGHSYDEGSDEFD